MTFKLLPFDIGRKKGRTARKSGSSFYNRGGGFLTYFSSCVQSRVSRSSVHFSYWEFVLNL